MYSFLATYAFHNWGIRESGTKGLISSWYQMICIMMQIMIHHATRQKIRYARKKCCKMHMRLMPRLLGDTKGCAGPNKACWYSSRCNRNSKYQNHPWQVWSIDSIYNGIKSLLLVQSRKIILASYHRNIHPISFSDLLLGDLAHTRTQIYKWKSRFS